MKKLLCVLILLAIAFAFTACNDEDEDEVPYGTPYALTGIWNDDDTQFASWYFGIRIDRPAHWERPDRTLYMAMNAFSEIFFMYEDSQAFSTIFEAIAGDDINFLHLRDGWILCVDRDVDISFDILRLPDDNPDMSVPDFMAARIMHILGNPLQWGATKTPWHDTEMIRIGHLDWHVSGITTTDPNFPQQRYFVNFAPDGFVRWINIGYFEEYRLEEALSLLSPY